MEVLDTLIRHDSQNYFRYPIDPTDNSFIDYSSRIDEPMDFTTIRNFLATREINKSEFCRLVNLVFDNAMAWNEISSPGYYAAKMLKSIFEREITVEKGENDTVVNLFDKDYKNMILGWDKSNEDLYNHIRQSGGVFLKRVMGRQTYRRITDCEAKKSKSTSSNH